MIWAVISTIILLFGIPVYIWISCKRTRRTIYTRIPVSLPHQSSPSPQHEELPFMTPSPSPPRLPHFVSPSTPIPSPEQHETPEQPVSSRTRSKTKTKLQFKEEETSL